MVVACDCPSHWRWYRHWFSTNGLVRHGRVITQSTLLTNRLDRQTSSLNTRRAVCTQQNTSLLASSSINCSFKRQLADNQQKPMMATPNTKSIKLEKNRPCFEHGREQHKASENIFSFLESSTFSPTKPTQLTPNDKIASERKESQLKTSVVRGSPIGPDQSQRSKNFLDQSESSIQPMWLQWRQSSQIWA